MAMKYRLSGDRRTDSATRARGTPRCGLKALVALLALGLMVSSAPAGATQVRKLRVVVSVLPQAYFVERIGGERVEVDVLVGPGQSPHAWEPTPRQVEGLARAQVYFRIGIDFENALVPRIEKMFRHLRIVDTRRNVPLRSMSADELAAAEADGAHEHGEACTHNTGATTAPAGSPDPHIWLSPLLAKIQAQTICDALVELDPEHAEEYRENLAAFHRDLDRVHARIAEVLAPLKGRPVFVYHPAFGYFTDTYGLRQVPVEIGGKEPTARQLAALIEKAKTAGAKVIFVQPQFPTKSAAAVAQAIGGAVVPIDDLPRDYLRNLEELADKIKAAVAP